jgi:hypothetical protein
LGNRPTSQTGQVVDPRADLWNKGQHSKLNCPTLLWKELTNRAAGEGQHNCCLVKTTALNILHKLAELPHLTNPTDIVDRRTKYYSQASNLVRAHQSFHLYANTRTGHLRNNSRTYTKRLNILWFLKLEIFIVFLSFF